MTKRLAAVLATALAAFACTTPQQPTMETDARPQRIVLHYDFAGDWVATAGDYCEERLDLSEGVFLTIAGAPDGGPAAFHIARFFMLEDASPAHALVGMADETGVLPLTVETEGVIDGRAAAITYDLTLQPEGPRRIRLTGFMTTVQDRVGQTVRADLLADAAADRTIPVLSAAGSRGLCLKRL